MTLNLNWNLVRIEMIEETSIEELTNIKNQLENCLQSIIKINININDVTEWNKEKTYYDIQRLCRELHTESKLH